VPAGHLMEFGSIGVHRPELVIHLRFEFELIQN
jgi:hypothetical protein